MYPEGLRPRFVTDRCLELSAASAGAVCQKLVDWIRLSATGAGTDVRNSGYYVASTGMVQSKACGIYVASTGTVKSENLCKRYMRVCSGIDTEMSSCIFSRSKVQRGRMVGRWGNQASGRLDAGKQWEYGIFFVCRMGDHRNEEWE